MTQPRSAEADLAGAEAERARGAVVRSGAEAQAFRYSRIIVALLSVIALVLAGWALRATYPVAMPLVLAFFLAVLVHPVERWLGERLPERLGWLSLALTMLLIVAVVAVFAGGLWLSFQLVASQSDEYIQQFQQFWHSLQDWAERNNLPLPEVAPTGEGGGGAFSEIAQYFASALSGLWWFIGVLVLVFFFVLLMLIEAAVWRRKAQVALPDDRAQAVLAALRTISVKIRQFLLIRTAIGVIAGVIAALWLFVTGVDFWYLWGFLFFALNYVPNLGSIIAGIPPILMALVQFGFGWALVVGIGLIASEQLLGNYLDPRLQGRTLDISPLVILFSVIFWGWIWGPVGAVLAVPITASIIIACVHVESLRPVALLLGGSADEEALDEQMHEGA